MEYILTCGFVYVYLFICNFLLQVIGFYIALWHIVCFGGVMWGKTTTLYLQ